MTKAELQKLIAEVVAPIVVKTVREELREVKKLMLEIQEGQRGQVMYSNAVTPTYAPQPSAAPYMAPSPSTSQPAPPEVKAELQKGYLAILQQTLEENKRIPTQDDYDALSAAPIRNIPNGAIPGIPSSLQNIFRQTAQQPLFDQSGV